MLQITPVGVNGSFTGSSHPVLTVVDTFATADLATDAQANSQTVELAYVNSEQIDTAFAVSDVNVKGITTESPKAYTATDAVLSGKTLTYSINWDALFAGITFDAPGYYNFTLKAVGDNVNLAYAQANTLNVKVAVTPVANDPTKLAVYDIFVLENGEKVLGETAPIAVPDNGGQNFVLSKDVKGIYADKNQAFTFTVKIANAQGHYAINFGAADHVSAITPVENGKINVATTDVQTYTVTLHHGQSMTINNLPVDATVTVEEAAAEGYIPSYTSTTQLDAVTGQDNQALAAGALTINKDAQSFVKFVNASAKDSSGILPTGLMMEVAPFVLIALAAIAGAVVFFVARHRKSDEF